MCFRRPHHRRLPWKSTGRLIGLRACPSRHFLAIGASQPRQQGLHPQAPEGQQSIVAGQSRSSAIACAVLLLTLQLMLRCLVQRLHRPWIRQALQVSVQEDPLQQRQGQPPPRGPVPRLRETSPHLPRQTKDSDHPSFPGLRPFRSPLVLHHQSVLRRVHQCLMA